MFGGDGVVLGAGLVLSADVTLRSMEINTTHDWFKTKPTVYFMCKDENMTVLPDVKEAHVLYNFKGQESWQVRDQTFIFLRKFEHVLSLRCSLRHYDSWDVLACVVLECLSRISIVLLLNMNLVLARGVSCA